MKSEHWATLWAPLLEQGLKDDEWPWDWTGSLLPQKQVQATIIAKAPGVWAGETLVAALPRPLSVRTTLKDGTPVKQGTAVATIQGPAQYVVAYERPLLNLASYASGIATQTHNLVALIKKACPKAPPRLTLTRKTLPHYRDLAVFSVQVGGGHAHRTGLSSGVLLKENHIAACGSISKAVDQARAQTPHTLKIEVEVRSLSELKQAIEANADIVMLDNFTPELIVKAVTLVHSLADRRRPLVEVSGGISEKNISQFAIPGVDIISIGSVTHSVTALDLSLLLKSVKATR